MNNIEILEEFIEDYKELVTQKKEVIIDYKYLKEKVQAIENLIKEYKELEDKCNELNFKYTAQWVDDNFIPKSKLQELREIDNIDLLQTKLKQFLEEGE